MKIELFTQDGALLATAEVEELYELVFWRSRFFVPQRDSDGELTGWNDKQSYVEVQAHVIA